MFFAGPAALVAFGVGLRTSRAIESHEAVMDRVRRHESAARVASASEGVDLPLLLAVASAESAGRPAARSSAGAVGLMQLMPATASEMAEAAREPRPDLTDAATSLRLGARYLRRQLARFDGEPCVRELALAAYNAGPERAEAWRSLAPDASGEPPGQWIPFSETRAFVRRVFDYEARWRDALRSR